MGEECLFSGGMVVVFRVTRGIRGNFDGVVFLVRATL